MINHEQLPSITNAKLPGAYTVAKRALAECEKIDECKDWANKSAALASYAKQAKDGSLYKLAIRIQARAIRRCGELLGEIAPNNGGRPSKETSTGTGTSLTRKQAAEEAGLSKRQKDTAIQVANVPEEEFEAQVESDSPPTVMALAEQGTQRKPLYDLEGVDPNLFKLATRALAFATARHGGGTPTLYRLGGNPYRVTGGLSEGLNAIGLTTRLRFLIGPKRSTVALVAVQCNAHHKPPCPHAPMPSVDDPIALYTVPGKGARHSGTTPNKSDCCIQAMQSIRIALVCLMRVTSRYVSCFPFQREISDNSYAKWTL
jgi:hypothetical protein